MQDPLEIIHRQIYQELGLIHPEVLIFTIMILKAILEEEEEVRRIIILFNPNIIITITSISQLSQLSFFQSDSNILMVEHSFQAKIMDI